MLVAYHGSSAKLVQYL